MKRRDFLNNSLIIGSASLFNSTTLGKTLQDKNNPDNSTRNNREDKRATAIQVSAPSTVGVNEKFWLGIRILTEPYFTEWTPPVESDKIYC